MGVQRLVPRYSKMLGEHAVMQAKYVIFVILFSIVESNWAEFATELTRHLFMMSTMSLTFASRYTLPGNSIPFHSNLFSLPIVIFCDLLCSKCGWLLDALFMFFRAACTVHHDIMIYAKSLLFHGSSLALLFAFVPRSWKTRRWANESSYWSAPLRWNWMCFGKKWRWASPIPKMSSNRPC